MCRFNEDFERLAVAVFSGDCAAAQDVLGEMRAAGSKDDLIMRAQRRAQPERFTSARKSDPNPMSLPLPGARPGDMLSGMGSKGKVNA